MFIQKCKTSWRRGSSAALVIFTVLMLVFLIAVSFSPLVRAQEKMGKKGPEEEPGEFQDFEQDGAPEAGYPERPPEAPDSGQGGQNPMLEPTEGPENSTSPKIGTSEEGLVFGIPASILAVIITTTVVAIVAGVSAAVLVKRRKPVVFKGEELPSIDRIPVGVDKILKRLEENRPEE